MLKFSDHFASRDDGITSSSYGYLRNLPSMKTFFVWMASFSKVPNFGKATTFETPH
jgi:hypothetical protein